jgi:hypothetical protein
MRSSSRTKSYEELCRLDDFADRYDYLREYGTVGMDTFGFERWLNQKFYKSNEWRRVRQRVIARDRGCDLGIEGRDIVHDVYIHHMNPIRVEDLRAHDPAILDLNFLISVSLRTHNAIHYGSRDNLEQLFVPRKAGDTKLW